MLCLLCLLCLLCCRPAGSEEKCTGQLGCQTSNERRRNSSVVAKRLSSCILKAVVEPRNVRPSQRNTLGGVGHGAVMVETGGKRRHVFSQAFVCWPVLVSQAGNIRRDETKSGSQMSFTWQYTRPSGQLIDIYTELALFRSSSTIFVLHLLGTLSYPPLWHTLCTTAQPNLQISGCPSNTPSVAQRMAECTVTEKTLHIWIKGLFRTACKSTSQPEPYFFLIL